MDEWRVHCVSLLLLSARQHFVKTDRSQLKNFSSGKRVNKISLLSKTIQFSLLIFLCAFAQGNELHEIEVITISPNTSISQSPLSVMDETVDIERQIAPITTISNLLANLPSVSFNGQGGQFQVNSIRGTSRWRVLTRINQAVIHTDRRAGVSTSFIDPDFVRQINVRKGGTATQYGSGALSGVISLNSTNFTDTWLTNRVETNGSQVKISTGVNIEGWSLGVSHNSQNNAEDADKNVLNTQFTRQSLYLRKNAPLNAEWEISFTGLISVGKDIGKTNNEDFLTTKNTIYPTEKHTLLQLTAYSDNNTQAGISVHKQSLHTEVTRFSKRVNRVANHSDDVFIFLRKDWDLANEHTLSLNYEWDARFNVEAKEQETQFLTSTTTQQQALDGQQQTHSLVFTWQKTWDAFTALAGYRANYLHQNNTAQQNTHGLAVKQAESAQFSTGYINLHLQLTPHTSVMGSIGNSFRFPSLSERFFAGTTGRGELIGNAQLLPEKSMNTEIGIQHKQDKHHFKAAIYVNNVDNFIERVAIIEEVEQFQNRDSGSIYGIEAQWDYALSSTWNYQVSGDWQRSQLTDHASENAQYLADTAPASLRSTLTYHRESFALELQHLHRFAFNRPTSGEVSLPSVSTFSIAANWQVIPSLKLSLWVNNLTNQRFLTTTDNKSTTAMGRNIGLNLHWLLH